jgi:hypothetical protein
LPDVQNHYYTASTGGEDLRAVVNTTGHTAIDHVGASSVCSYRAAQLLALENVFSKKGKKHNREIQKTKIIKLKTTKEQKTFKVCGVASACKHQKNRRSRLKF